VTVPASVKGTLLLAVTLTAGVVVGVAYERHRTPAHHAARTDSHHVLRHLNDYLGLDSAQHEAIAAVLARRQGTIDSTWHSVQPHVRAMLDSTLQEIAGVLRPDQMVKFRKIVETMHPRTLQ
jgi:hypothetical protein